MAKQKIRILLNGPYEVLGNVPLQQEVIVPDEAGASKAWQKEKVYPENETYYLCRCGHSSNKPYCDGTHITVQFVGTEVASNLPYDQQAGVYRGKELDLMDQESLCAVARFCDRGKGVW
ncbi:MAG: CDGSH iron-sulfur domain-containing protein [Christensenellaceae bacterium]|jgi:CDGSH-type Zn-finger protein